MTAIAALMLLQRPALAGPTGGTVVQGSAGIQQSGSTTNINQSTDKAIINWQGFSVGSGETVNFNQPSAAATTLNRVIGNESSVINGALNANGQVFIVNSAGVLFGKGAQVNVGGLVASTLDISNADFMAGKYTFSGNSAASVVNQGKIKAGSGGYVSLLGQTVANDGVIVANLGTVAMASGQQVTLNFGGNSLVDVTIDKGALNAMVSNNRAIIANGGQVIMTAKAADEVLSAQVNNSGVIQARTMGSLTGGSDGSSGTVHLGKIKLVADGGNVNVSGKLNVSARGSSDAGSILVQAKGGTTKVSGTLKATAVNGKGGSIETSGDSVKIADSAVITTKSTAGATGTWLVDPTDFTIAASGGDITGTALSAALALNNVSYTTSQGASGTSGNLYVNDAVTWTADTTLSLTAANNLYVNSPIAATGANAGLNLAATAGTLYVNNGITLSGENAALAMSYGTGYAIRTLASYSGTDTNATLGTSVTYGVYGDLDAVVYSLNGTGGFPATTGTGYASANNAAAGTTYGSVTLSGSNASLAMNGTSYTLIHSMAQLDALDGQNSVTGTGTASTVTGLYALAGNLDASGTPYSTAVIQSFGGAFEGLGHTISNLSIADTVGGNTGLFGIINSSGSVQNLGLVNANVSRTTTNVVDPTAVIPTSSTYGVGVLAGTNDGTISYSYANGGSVTTRIAAADDRSYMGGLVGVSSTGISYSATNLNVSLDASAIGGLASYTGISYIGGLVGRATGISVAAYDHDDALGSVSGGSNNSNYSAVGGLIGGYVGGSSTPAGTVEGTSFISNSYTAGGTVSGIHNVGGLIGSGPAITSSFSSDDVIATGNTAGGLAGSINGVVWSYATGNVTAAGYNAGGLVGSGGGINNSYATGDVTGLYNVGGLAGGAGSLIGGFSKVSNTHATGNVTAIGTNSNGYAYAGGLLGTAAGAVSNSYYAPATKTVTVDGTTTTVTNKVSAICGSTGGGTCTTGSVTYANPNTGVSTTTTGSGNGVGGLIGYIQGTTSATGPSVTNSYSTGDVYAPNSIYVGGLVGYDQDAAISGTTVANSDGSTTVSSYSYATGNVTGKALVGGLVGVLTNTATTGNYNMTLNGTYAAGSVTAWAGFAGGLVGVAYSAGSSTTTAPITVLNSYATGSVTNLGASNNPYTTTAYSVDTTTTPAAATAIATQPTSPVSIGLVKSHLDTSKIGTGASSYAGGLIGYVNNNFTVINNASASGSVTNNGTGGYTGGLIGEAIGQFTAVTNSSASGNVVAAGNYAGGLIGDLQGGRSEIANVTTTGNVTSSGDYVSGLVGNYVGNYVISGTTISGGLVSNATASGAVTGEGDHVGGLFGSQAGGLVIGSTYTPPANPGNGDGGTTPPNDPNNNGNGGTSDNPPSGNAGNTSGGASPVQRPTAAQAAAAANVTGTTDTQMSAVTPPTLGLAAAGTEAVEAAAPPAVEDDLKATESNIKTEEQRERRRIAAAASVTASAPRQGAGHRGGNYGATIRSIEVDGQRFNLQNGAPKQDAPVQAPR